MVRALVQRAALPPQATPSGPLLPSTQPLRLRNTSLTLLPVATPGRRQLRLRPRRDTSMTDLDISSTTSSADEADRIARTALTLLTEPCHPTLWSMTQQDGAQATLDRLLTGDIPDAKLRTAVTVATRRGDVRRLAHAVWRHAQRLGARLVVPGDSEWPGQINDLTQLKPAAERPTAINTAPPLCLWVRGERLLSEAFSQSVAIVGARSATAYGLQVSADVASGLAARGWSIVSGGAFGVEAAAHRGALAARGLTISVLACGIDRPFPVGNSAMFDRIIADGLLVSPWPLGAEPLRHRFAIRNRLLATAAGTVLVEAAARSGAVQTVSRALDLGRAAMVVPGPVTSALSTGCHHFLRAHAGARVVTSAADVITELSRTSR
ncbi:DNA-processing protein DprA [Actinoplanes sp. NBRC 103695]|uniref:DNA-processing protein DprA n=1 Tax=Actinoplanes sp. NBRC 103695 TaxID=3032202 RepID=UPI0025545DFF|nr:DNA-processing protein DprA [Actinoplanes sp. NBRC 103695]